jgi:hypothetical protein
MWKEGEASKVLFHASLSSGKSGSVLIQVSGSNFTSVVCFPAMKTQKPATDSRLNSIDTALKAGAK